MTKLATGNRKVINWEFLADNLINNCITYHEFYYKQRNFSGPSLHFHKRALSASGEDKIEMIYALLTSWGMHRMGGGAQMNEFDVFSSELRLIIRATEHLKSKDLSTVSRNDFDFLETFFNNSRLMKSSKKLVALSKVLAHINPDLFVPIDNEYTLQFISQQDGNKRLPKGWTEFQFFKEIHLSLFKQVYTADHFSQAAEEWLSKPSSFCWDTSRAKIIDNLIIGKIGQRKSELKNAK